VIAGTIAGWSCTSPGPAQFDGGYNIQKLPVDHSYTAYAEPLDGAVDPSQMANAIQTFVPQRHNRCWLATQFSCVVPASNTEFTARTEPGP
jgi:hypothetical protein